MRNDRTYLNLSTPGQEDRTADMLDKLFDPSRAASRVSEAEIAHLVSMALNDALRALGRRDPEWALECRAEEAQSGLHEQFQSLPPVQRADPTVLAEYRKAVAFQEATRELALQMVNAIQRYAAVSEREMSNQIM